MTFDVASLAKVRWMARTGRARRIREAAAVTQSELGAAVGVTAACVSRWERGQRVPRGSAAVDYLAQLELLRHSEADPLSQTLTREIAS